MIPDLFLASSCLTSPPAHLPTDLCTRPLTYLGHELRVRSEVGPDEAHGAPVLPHGHARHVIVAPEARRQQLRQREAVAVAALQPLQAGVPAQRLGAPLERFSVAQHRRRRHLQPLPHLRNVIKEII